jgi:LicD family
MKSFVGLSLSVLLLLIPFGSASEGSAFEFPKQTQPETPSYFDAYGSVNTHFGLKTSTQTFMQPSKAALSNLFKSYALTMRDLGITTWLTQGTLLSWHWNKHVFPWETDIDMHMPLPDLSLLARYYNMTVYPFRFPDTPDGQINEYLLDINPHFQKRIVNRQDKNRVDARWVDMSNGAYIDITALHLFDAKARERGKPILWQTKDGHVYSDADVYPLRRTVFEGVEAFVPAEAEKISAKQYGDDALTNNLFHGYKFDEHERQWIAIQPI